MLRTYLATLAAVVHAILFASGAATACAADGLGQFPASVSQALKVVKPPVFVAHRPQHATTPETLAKHIDAVERHIETYGTVVPQHPNVWGQARLTKHRQEFEREFSKRFDESKFHETLQAALRRSDQSYLAAALGLESAIQQQAGEQQGPTDQVFEVIGAANKPELKIITRTEPGKVDLGSFQTQKLSLEPTIVADQMKRYFDHLNELRRVNEGDDVADSPGYSLNLVRIPISVLPGKHTRRGYGAEVTVTIEPNLSPELLPSTFRNLVINDVVDQFAFVVWRNLKDKTLSRKLEMLDRLYEEKERIAFAKDKDIQRGTLDQLKREFGDLPDLLADVEQITQSGNKQLAPEKAINAIQAKLFDDLAISLPQNFAPSRRSRLAFPSTQTADIFGDGHVMAHVVVDGQKALHAIVPNANLPDVKRYLRTELESAYEFLSLPESQTLWNYCHPALPGKAQYFEPKDRHLVEGFGLADAILGRKRYPKDTLPCRPANTPWPASGQQADEFPPVPSCHPTPILAIRNAYFNEIKAEFPRAKHTTTVSLAWAILVESALLNDQLLKDMRHIEQERGCRCLPAEWLPFYGPDPPPESRMAFNEYVRCRWPIHVFALDPITQDQNVADVFNQRRELQLAAAVAVAQGNMSMRAAGNFVRRLETDLETISLNRTMIAFSHGNDTFGWRFYPRFQSPPIPGTFGAFNQTLFGAPDPKDRRTWELEPGTRECVAIVIMPSFVPYVSFQTRANWFQLNNPRKKQLTLQDAVALGRDIQGIRHAAHYVSHCDQYRPADVAHLMRAVEQLDRRLPLQDMLVQIPFENTLGGFEMFSTGVTDLAPELFGWYGEPGVAVCKKTHCHAHEDKGVLLTGEKGEQCAGTCGGTTLFLVGDGFSVHDTKVIAGGQCVPFLLLSRQVMQVTIPCSVNVDTKLEDGETKQFVDVHVATPYGVSSHVEIPVCQPPTDTQIADIEYRLSRLESPIRLNTGIFEATFEYELEGKSTNVGAVALVGKEGITPVNGPLLLVNVAYTDANTQLQIPRTATVVVVPRKSPRIEQVRPFPFDGIVEFKLGEQQKVDGRQAALAADKFAELIEQIIAAQGPSPALNCFTNGNLDKIEFVVDLFVRLDGDSQPKQVSPELKVVLCNRKAKCREAPQPAGGKPAGERNQDAPENEQPGKPKLGPKGDQAPSGASYRALEPLPPALRQERSPPPDLNQPDLNHSGMLRRLPPIRDDRRVTEQAQASHTVGAPSVTKR